VVAELTQEPPETAVLEPEEPNEDDDELGAVPPPNRLCTDWLESLAELPDES
jgi:hypothetical protein